METVVFNTQITHESDYFKRDFDFSVQVWANVKTYKQPSYPIELVVDLEEVEIDHNNKQEDIPYKIGQSFLSHLDKNTIEFLKDEAVRRMS